MFPFLSWLAILLSLQVFDEILIRIGLSNLFIDKSLKTLKPQTIYKMLFYLDVSTPINSRLLNLACRHISTLISRLWLILPDSAPCILYANFPLFHGMFVLLRVKLVEIGLFELSLMNTAQDMLVDGRLLIGKVIGKLMHWVYLILLDYVEQGLQSPIDLLMLG